VNELRVNNAAAAVQQQQQQTSKAKLFRQTNLTLMFLLL